MPAPTLLFFIFPFVFSWGLTAILFIPYFLPTIIALMRRSANTGGIFLLNFFAGWTGIGWIISLIWAIAGRTTNDTTIIVNNTYPANGGQPYTQQPSYDPPPYSSEPTRGTHQTSPTLRRPSTPSGGQDTARH